MCLTESLSVTNPQLAESKLATQAAKDELAEAAQRYQGKLAQWEDAQEALDQLADELQSGQKLLLQSQHRAEHLEGLTAALQEQVHALTHWSILCMDPDLLTTRNV